VYTTKLCFTWQWGSWHNAYIRTLLWMLIFSLPYTSKTNPRCSSIHMYACSL